MLLTLSEAGTDAAGQHQQQQQRTRCRDGSHDDHCRPTACIGLKYTTRYSAEQGKTARTSPVTRCQTRTFRPPGAMGIARQYPSETQPRFNCALPETGGIQARLHYVYKARNLGRCVHFCAVRKKVQVIGKHVLSHTNFSPFTYNGEVTALT